MESLSVLWIAQQDIVNKNQMKEHWFDKTEISANDMATLITYKKSRIWLV